MNKQTNSHAKTTEPANPLLNAALVAAISFAVLPAAIFGAVRCFQSRSDASAKPVEVEEESASKRTSAAERRAQRLEARKAKEAKDKNIHPEITMEKVEPYYDDFGTNYNADMEFNGFGMMPPPYMGGPGMMPAPYMDGPGLAPVPDRGGFNRRGRMPGAEFGFDNGFGGGRGGF